MTKIEKKQLLEAVDLISDGIEIYSCYALNFVSSNDKFIITDLTKRYAEFFTEEAPSEIWIGLHAMKNGWGYTSENVKDLRIMLLLMFREAGE